MGRACAKTVVLQSAVIPAWIHAPAHRIVADVAWFADLGKCAWPESAFAHPDNNFAMALVKSTQTPVVVGRVRSLVVVVRLAPTTNVFARLTPPIFATVPASTKRQTTNIAVHATFAVPILTNAPTANAPTAPPIRAAEARCCAVQPVSIHKATPRIVEDVEKAVGSVNAARVVSVFVAQQPTAFVPQPRKIR